MKVKEANTNEKKKKTTEKQPYHQGTEIPTKKVNAICKAKKVRIVHGKDKAREALLAQV